MVALPATIVAQLPTGFRDQSTVWGTRDPILGIGHLGRMRPAARIIRAGAGHFLQEEVPEPLPGAIVEVAGLATWS